MDPIAILQSRIEQLEAKLGLSTNVVPDSQQGDTTTHQLDSGQAVNNDLDGHEKLTEAMHLPSELNNYTEHNFINTVSQGNPAVLERSAAAVVEAPAAGAQALDASEQEPVPRRRNGLD